MRKVENETGLKFGQPIAIREIYRTKHPRLTGDLTCQPTPDARIAKKIHMSVQVTQGWKRSLHSSINTDFSENHAERSVGSFRILGRVLADMQLFLHLVECLRLGALVGRAIIATIIIIG